MSETLKTEKTKLDPITNQPLKAHTRRPMTAAEKSFIRVALYMHFPKQEIASFLGRDQATLSWCIKRHRLSPRKPTMSELTELATNYNLTPHGEL